MEPSPIPLTNPEPMSDLAMPDLPDVSTHNFADAEAQARIKNEFEGGADSGAEVLYRRKDGSEFWTAVFISASYCLSIIPPTMPPQETTHG